MSSDAYQPVVQALESDLSRVAKTSFEGGDTKFLGGGELLAHFEQRWSGEQGRAQLENRTPLQLERDRILYSQGLRRQAEKYHVLYNGRKRIVRSYATHTMRCAQVTRAIARGLGLNQDFAEAIALGSKIGATPFVHAAKGATDKWLRDTILAIDEKCDNPNDQRSGDELFDAESDFQPPAWIQRIKAVSIHKAVSEFLPWAEGIDVDTAYSSGQQSYWALCCNPLTLEAKPRQFQPETMFGIWRHSRKLKENGIGFRHRIEMVGGSEPLELDGSRHATFEARVVQVADDITWAIENLEDAHTAAMLNEHNPPSLYKSLEASLETDEPDPILSKALHDSDSGGLYTYFIRDFVKESGPVIERLENDAPGPEARKLLGAGNPQAAIGLSAAAESVLDQMMKFLDKVVFTEARVSNRREMLEEVSKQCLRLLYQGDVETLVTEECSRVPDWNQQERAKSLLKQDVYRAQASVTLFAQMSDQEIYDFVGIQSL